MKNTRKATKKNAVTETYRDVLMRTRGSARVSLIQGGVSRFLGGEEFCVFPSLDHARKEISYLLSNEYNARTFDAWEIQVHRGSGEWASRSAGEGVAA